MQQPHDADQVPAQGRQEDCHSPGSPSAGGADFSGQKIVSKPSDDNQRHSNKVEAIEVRLNTDFYSNQADEEQHAQATVAAHQASQQDMGVKQPQQVMDHGPNDEQMKFQQVTESVVPGQQQHHQYAISLARMGINERLDRILPDPNEDYDQFGSAGAYHTSYKLQPLDGGQVVEDVDSPGGFGGTGQGNNGGASSMFVDSVGGQVDQDVVGAAVLNSADTGQNDKRFYTLAELAEMEPMFERQFYNDGSGTNQHNAHVLLSPQEYRAKLYWLDPENRWKDIGTGRFRLLLSKDQEEHYIQVVSEDCMEDQIALENDINIDKVVNSIIPGQADGSNAQSPQGANGQGSLIGGGQGHVAPKQEFLHRCFVFCLQEFSRQGDTIITWQDDYKNEFALSFQDEKGAQNTWWSICFLKGIQINSNIDEPNEAGGSSETNSITGNGVVLPTKENLAELANDLFSPDAYTRRNIAEAVLKQEESMSRGNNNGNSSELSERDHTKLHSWKSQYLDKLQKIFNEVEYQFQKAQKAMEDNEGDEHDRYIHMQQQVNHLHSLFQIFRNLLNLNQSELLEVLLNENYWVTTFGALEYDPEVFSPLGNKYDNQNGAARSPVGQKPSGGSSSLVSSPNSNARSYGNYDHFEQANQYNSYFAQEADFRDFLRSKVKFKQAVVIEDLSVINSIHLSYKLQYLKDTAMARFIDENTSHTIMQLVSSHHQIILDYIFGEDFERIQAELISKMRDNSNVQDKENALKFFLEICALLKSINLTNRQLQTCNQAFLKIMQVLAQIFDIMLPDRSTLIAEVKQDKEGLVRIFETRHLKDLEKTTSAAAAAAARTQQQQQNSSANNVVAPPQAPDTKEEFVDHESLLSSNEHPITINSPTVEGDEKAFEDGFGTNMPSSGATMTFTTQDSIINPSRSTVEEYLKNPLHSEDPSMTQIDILKSNSIEIFYNLLILLNNVNHSTIREFLCSDHQKKHNYVFLRHLAQHMIFTSQQGIKVSICEFFKDLTSKETSEMQKNFQQVILFQVVSQFVDFLSEEDSMENIEEAERKKLLIAKATSESGAAAIADTEMKDEEQKSQDSRQTIDPKISTAYRKQVDQSRILILQFLNKLIVDNVDSYQLRMFFMSKKVLLKVADCYQYNSIQTNVEVIKFFKAIIQAKDTMSTKYMIQKQIFDTILDIFLNNKTKGNLLHSCILNLFEMLTPADMSNSATGNSNAPSMLGMGLDGGYGAAPKMEGGYVQTPLLHKLYAKLNENGYVKRVFLHKNYKDGFRKFNQSLMSSLDIQSEQDSKKASDRDRSNSQDRRSGFYQPRGDQSLNRSGNKSGVSNRDSPFDSHNSQQAQLPIEDVENRDSDENNENELMEHCFPGESNSGADGANMSDNMQKPNRQNFDDQLHSELHQSQGHQHVDNPVASQDNELQLVDASGKEIVDEQGGSRLTNAAQQVNDDVHNVQAEMSPIPNDKPNDELQEPHDKLNQASNDAQIKRKPSEQSSHSNRANRSQSPISGHAEQVQRKSPTVPSKMRSGNPAAATSKFEGLEPLQQSSPEMEDGKNRRRRLSQEDIQGVSSLARNVARQGSNNSNKMLNFSDEASNGKQGGKQAFSETMSNPDDDEIYFNKDINHPAPVAPTGFAFKIRPPTQSLGIPHLKLHRQHSPIEGLLFAAKEVEETTSPKLRHQKPTIKIGGSKHGHLKKPHAVKRERGRRACSEQGPDRDNLALTTPTNHNNDDQAGTNQDNQEVELQRLLESKLDQSGNNSSSVLPHNSKLQEIRKHHSTLDQLRRGESICDSGFPEGGTLAGTKRKRNEGNDAASGEAGQEEDKQDEQARTTTTQLLKETWMSKRPKLAETTPHVDETDHQADKEHQQMQHQQLQQQQNSQSIDQVMNNDDEDAEAVKQLLNASVVRRGDSSNSQDKEASKIKEKLNDNNQTQ